MKDWKYYSNPPAPYFTYTEDKAWRKERMDAIDNSKMTRAEREAAVNGLAKEAAEFAKEYNKEYYEQLSRLDKEFWADAREELRYEEFLSPSAVGKLEYKAYEDGHSSGYSEIHYHLQSFSDFVREILDANKVVV